MFRSGKWLFAVALAVASVWGGFALIAQEPKPAVGADDAKPVDLSALREAVDTAGKRGENVDEIRKALDAFEKAKPTVRAARVPAELQTLRDAVDAAAKKGENVEAIAKELVAVEMAVAGRTLAKPRPEVRPDVPPNPLVPFPVVPFPAKPGARIDVEAFQKAMDLRVKALELLKANPRDPEALKLSAEADRLMMKALMPGAGANVMPLFPEFPDVGRVPERARFGIRLEKVNPITAEQLGIDANVGIAVTAVVPGSVAERAGLKVHDIILEFAGKAVSDDTEDFIRQVNAAKSGEKIDLVVVRKGKKLDVKGVVLPDVGAAPRPVPRPARPALPPVLPLPGLLPELPNGQPLPGLVPPIPERVIDSPVRANADEPKTAKPDLGDLRDAIATANKRGENVRAISEAFAALEKALAKNAAKPGEAPPELTALRTAVESAAKKGENVEAIAKELALVEKAITGREYERPKPPEPPKPEPVPPFRRPGGGIVINGGDFNGTSITISNGNFTIKARRGDVTYTVTGTADATVAPKIIIKDGDKTTETDDLKKVPDAHRPAVERLLKMVSR